MPMPIDVPALIASLKGTRLPHAAIAKAAGVSHNTVQRLMSGTTQKLQLGSLENLRNFVIAQASVGALLTQAPPAARSELAGSAASLSPTPLTESTRYAAIVAWLDGAYDKIMGVGPMKWGEWAARRDLDERWGEKHPLPETSPIRQLSQEDLAILRRGLAAAPRSERHRLRDERQARKAATPSAGPYTPPGMADSEEQAGARRATIDACRNGGFTPGAPFPRSTPQTRG